MSVRHALLALLSEGPKYGLQLREEFEARTGEVWPLNVGQVYTTLQRLERDGLVESEGIGDDGPQKGFQITADGLAELAGWLHTPPAGALALLGAVLGTVAAYIAAIAYSSGNPLDGLSGLSNIPLRNLLIIVVGMPLVAAAVGWLLAGREPAAIGHQPLE